MNPGCAGQMMAAGGLSNGYTKLPLHCSNGSCVVCRKDSDCNACFSKTGTGIVQYCNSWRTGTCDVANQVCSFPFTPK
jgi:hypothetical protein